MNFRILLILFLLPLSSFAKEQIPLKKNNLEVIELEENPDEDKVTEKTLKLSGHWNIFIGYVSWTYKISFMEETLSKEQGLGLGIGHDWQNSYFGIGTDFYAAYLKATTASGLINLNMPVGALILRPKVFWRPLDQFRISFHLPLLYRYGFSTWNKKDYNLNLSEFTIGYFMGMEWDIQNITLGISGGKYRDFEASSWTWSLGYRF